MKKERLNQRDTTGAHSTSSPISKPTNVRWMIVLLLFGFTFLAHFNRVSISVAANAEFIGPGKLSEEQMGLIYSAFLLVYTIGMLPGGYFIDRVGPRIAMTSMGLGLGFLAALTGMVGWFGLTLAAMFIPLLVIRMIGGATSVPLHPGSARTVSLWFPMEQRSLANAIPTAGALVGIAFCYPVFGWLLEQVGWQWALVISGAALMLFGLIWYFVSADNPAGHRWSNAGEQELVDRSGPVPSRTRATFGQVLGLFRNRSLVLLTISYGTLSYVQYLFFYWVEYYFKNIIKLPTSESRQVSFIIMIAMAVGMICGGWASDRICRWLGNTTGGRVMALGGMGLCALFCLMAVQAKEPQAVIWLLVLSQGALGLSEGIFWTTATALEKRNGGLACALLNTGGNGFGMLAPAFTPWIGRVFGWNAAINVACIACIIGGLLWFGIRPPSSTSHTTLEESPIV